MYHFDLPLLYLLCKSLDLLEGRLLVQRPFTFLISLHKTAPLPNLCIGLLDEAPFIHGRQKGCTGGRFSPHPGTANSEVNLGKFEEKCNKNWAALSPPGKLLGSDFANGANSIFNLLIIKPFDDQQMVIHLMQVLINLHHLAKTLLDSQSFGVQRENIAKIVGVYL